jgi:homospermidine synthase
VRESTGELLYRPTVNYSYHPSDDTVLSLHEAAGKNWKITGPERVIGPDESPRAWTSWACLLMGSKKGVYWYGSRSRSRRRGSSHPTTRRRACRWSRDSSRDGVGDPQSRRGVVEPDELDHEMVLEIANPYLGEVVGVYGDWTPIKERFALFGADIDADPWQFKNFRVT